MTPLVALALAALTLIPGCASTNANPGDAEAKQLHRDFTECHTESNSEEPKLKACLQHRGYRFDR